MLIHRFRGTAILAYLKTALSIVRGFALAKIIIVFLGASEYGLWMSLLGTLSISTVLTIANFQFLGNQLNEAFHASENATTIVNKAGSNLVFGGIINVLVSIVFLYNIQLDYLTSLAFLGLVVSHNYFLFGFRFLIRYFEPRGRMFDKVKFELFAEALEICLLLLGVWIFESLIFLLLSLSLAKVFNYIYVRNNIDIDSFNTLELSILHLKPNSGILAVLLGEKLFAEGFLWVLTFTSSYLFISSFSLYRGFVNFGIMMSITYLMIVIPKIQGLSLREKQYDFEIALLKSYFVSFGILFVTILLVKNFGYQVLAYFVNVSDLNDSEDLICLFGFVVGVQTAISQIQKILPDARTIFITITARFLAIVLALVFGDFVYLMMFVISSEIAGVVFYLYRENLALKYRIYLAVALIMMGVFIWAV